MLVLYVILTVSTLAVIGAGIAFHYRVKRHMQSPGEIAHSEGVSSGEVTAPGEKPTL